MVPFNYQSQHFYLTIPSKPWPPAPLHGIIAAAARSIQRQRDCKVFSCAPGVTQSFHTLFTPRMRMKGQSLHWVQVRFSIIHQLQNAGSNYIIIIYNYICICVFYVYIYINQLSKASTRLKRIYRIIVLSSDAWLTSTIETDPKIVAQNCPEVLPKYRHPSTAWPWMPVYTSPEPVSIWLEETVGICGLFKLSIKMPMA